MSAVSLIVAYELLCDHPGLADVHVSIDRDRSGGQTVNVAGDWIETAGIAGALEVARELELELILTKAGMRLGEYSDKFSERVRAVKQTLAEDTEQER